jgi:hypothetical protein
VELTCPLQNDPDLAAAIQAGTQRFKEAFLRQQRRQRDAAMEKQRQIEVSLCLQSLRSTVALIVPLIRFPATQRGSV